MIDTIRLQAHIARGPDNRLFVLLGSAVVVILGATIWFVPSSERILIWGAITLSCLTLVPLLWREGHTWIILWLAPVAAISPFPDPLIRAAKYGLVLTAVAVAILKRRIDPPPAVPFDRRPFYPAIVLLVWIWIRALTGSAPMDGLFEALRLTLVAGLIYLWISEAPVAGGRQRWFYIWVLMGLYQVGACLVESIQWGRIRSYGTFASPNSLGAYLVLTIAIVQAAAIWAPARRARMVAWLSLPALLFGLYLTGSRASWLGTAVALLVIIVVARHWKLLALAAVTFGLLAGIYYTNPVIHFAVNTALRLEGGLTHRPMLWDATDRSIRRAPWIGYGIDAGSEQMMAEARYPSSAHRRLVSGIISVGSPHNFYRELVIETGLVGLAIMIAVIFALIRHSRSRLRSNDRWRAVYALALFAATIGVAVHSWFERSIFLGAMSAAVFYWFMVAQTARPDDPSPAN